jgi:type I restriction enzyme, S subunit
MKVRPGYKLTEVGTIPEDWDAVPLEAVTTHIGDGLHGTPVYSLNGGFFFINGNNLQDGKIVVTNETKTVDQTEFAKHQKPLSDRSILMSINGTIGNLALFDGEAIVLGKSAAYVNVKREVSKFYVYHSLQTQLVKCQFFDGLTGSTIGNLGLATIRNTRIPLPPTESEQCAIAAALNDVDALLSGLERLIAKKHDLKQAAMQQLLTGQTRLPSFYGEWDVKRLRDIGEISGAGVDKKSHPNEMSVRLLNYMDVYKMNVLRSDDFWHGVTAKPDQVRRCSVQRGDIFFTPTSEIRDDIGHSAVAIEDIPDVVYSYHVVRLRLFENWDVRYRAYAFKAKDFMDQASTQCEGSGTRYVITLPKFRSMTVRFPTDVKEQSALAAVFSDMDAELSVLKARRDKTRILKQAMMQELLTGKTRLVPSGD